MDEKIERVKVEGLKYGTLLKGLEYVLKNSAKSGGIKQWTVYFTALLKSGKFDNIVFTWERPADKKTYANTGEYSIPDILTILEARSQLERFFGESVQDESDPINEALALIKK